MKVYLIMQDEYRTGDYNRIMGVYATKEHAEDDLINECGKTNYFIREEDLIDYSLT